MRPQKASPSRGGGSAKPRRRRSCQICDNLSVSLAADSIPPLLSLRDISPDRGNRPLKGEPFPLRRVHPLRPFGPAPLTKGALGAGVKSLPLVKGRCRAKRGGEVLPAVTIRPYSQRIIRVPVISVFDRGAAGDAAQGVVAEAAAVMVARHDAAELADHRLPVDLPPQTGSKYSIGRSSFETAWHSGLSFIYAPIIHDPPAKCYGTFCENTAEAPTRAAA